MKNQKFYLLIKVAKKIESISYAEMLDIADEGAKVLHYRCVEVGEKFKVPMVAKSTFNEGTGTAINSEIEGVVVKSIVKGKKDFEVTVEFESGSKRMLASFAKLKKC